MRDGLEDLDSRIDAAETQAADYSGKADLFRSLHEVVRLDERTEMDYYSFSRDETTRRIVDPYHLVFKDGFWYLVAYCHTRGEVRLFRVDRIQRLRLIGEKFQPPRDFKLDAYLGSAWAMERGEEFTFRVRFWDESARFVQETQFHPSQSVFPDPSPHSPDPSRQADDGNEPPVIFTAKACGLRSVTRWVLAFGAEAEVLEPEELRSMVAEELRRGAGRYR